MKIRTIMIDGKGPFITNVVVNEALRGYGSGATLFKDGNEHSGTLASRLYREHFDEHGGFKNLLTRDSLVYLGDHRAFTPHILAKELATKKHFKAKHYGEGGKYLQLMKPILFELILKVANINTVVEYENVLDLKNLTNEPTQLDNASIKVKMGDLVLIRALSKEVKQAENYEQAKDRKEWGSVLGLFSGPEIHIIRDYNRMKARLKGRVKRGQVLGLFLPHEREIIQAYNKLLGGKDNE